jgi:drug/metabolite transporter (DMT)-like permease
MFLSENLNLRRVLPSVLAGSVAFGLVNVMEKLVYNRTNFVSGYVIFTLGTFAGAIAMLLRPEWRRQIFATSEHASPRSRFWYFINRFVNGLGSFLVYYAISLTAPAVVDAVTAVRYVIIFIGAWLLTQWRPDWLKEEFSGRTLAAKIVGTGLVIAGLVLLSLSGGGGQIVGEMPPALREESRVLCGSRHSAAASARSAIVKQNVEPAPGWDIAQMRPPWPSTIFLAMARPIPVPGAWASRRLKIPKI